MKSTWHDNLITVMMDPCTSFTHVGDSIDRTHLRYQQEKTNDDKLSAFVESAFSSDLTLSPRDDDERDAEYLANLCRLALRVHTAAKKLPNDAPHNKWQHRCHQPLVDGIGATT